MNAHRPRRPLRLERLEDRATPAAFGNPWPDPQNLTISFAPDGTKIDGADSRLYSQLGARMSESVWQLEALRAFQTWAAPTNVNVGLATDSGKPFGEAGPIQGSPWFGDIRVGSRPLAAGQLAVATPFDFVDAAAGDVIVNSGSAFSKGGATGTYDLYTVLLQEAGHALGLPNSPDAGSAMFTTYQGPRAGLGTGDAAAVQAMYGVRTPDRFDAVGSNGTLAAATPVRFISDADQFKGTDPTEGGTPWVAAGDLTTATDVDFYRFTVPSGSNDFFAQLRTSGVSLLTARLSVFNDRGVLVRSAAAADPRSGDLSLFVSGARAGRTYYLKVEAADPAFGVGAYRLAVGKEANEALFPSASSGAVNPDYGKNDTRTTATDLKTLSLAAGGQWEESIRASIESDKDRDFYRFKTGPAPIGGVVVAAWATEAEKLEPVVRAYTKDGLPLAVEVLGNDASTYTMQLRDLAPNTEYVLEVAAADPQSSYKEGNYFLAVDLRATPVNLNQLAAGTLTESGKQAAFQLTTTAARTHHFSLALAGVAGEAAARVTIYNEAGAAVASFVAKDGETVGTDVVLGPGTYTVKVSGGARSGTLSPLGYTLRGLVRDDPIGPQADDPTDAPSGSVGGFNYVFGPAPWLSFVDSYSDPWYGL